MKTKLPTNAIIAVTLNCNSKCLMCDIWKTHSKQEISPEIFKKLPPSLKDINITGGEPFLRHDLPKIIKNIKTACPKARIIINTNGFLTKNINRQIDKLVSVDPKIAVRISLDGIGNMHNEIRGIPEGFQKAVSTLLSLKSKVKDLGISCTIMNKNYPQLEEIYNFASSENLEFSLTLVSDSPIYFGQNKISLQPKDQKKFQDIFFKIIKKQYQTNNPKNWFRSWFEEKLFEFYQTKKRFLQCDAASDFFYLDSCGNIFPCHFKNQPLGNLSNQKFNDIWFSKTTRQIQKSCQNCNQCWQICTAKTSIKKNLSKICLEILSKKIKYLW